MESPNDIRNDGQEFKLETGLDEIQENNFEQDRDVKEDIEIKEEPFDIKEEYAKNRQPIEQIFVLDESQSLIGVADEGEQDSKVRSSGSRPLTSESFDFTIIENCQDSFRCRFCNFTFKNIDNLTSHLKTHDNKKFKCAHCSYESNRKIYLKSHLLTHSNLKLFKCSECSYECKHSRYLKKHIVRKHGAGTRNKYMNRNKNS